MSVIERRYRAELRMDVERVAVKDDVEGRTIAWCETADDASRITAALNKNEGAVDLLREAEPFVVWPSGTPVEARERWASAVASLIGGQ